uniref:NADH-ubiquinone oxidoreductase chain 3 n=1 Tax=Pleurobranchaea novaezealandiae TaxID=1883448 RepID=A0A1C9M3K2_9GAST|nr:NADH dehydrogenase subunit 3 [Pleurobranchaea novaezealandiae]
MMFALALTLILLVVYNLTFFNSYNGLEEKLTAFECGFDPMSKMRSPFSTRFFLLIVLFLIFDIEVALLFPVLTLMTNSAPAWTIIAWVAFLSILLFGMFHEWNEGALDWVTS